MSEPSGLAANPLVNPPQQDFNAPPLGLVKPVHVEPAVDWALARARKNIEAIVNNPNVPTFENTIEALAFANEDLGDAMTPFGLMKSALNTKEVQDVNEAILPKLTQYSTEVSLNVALFKRVKDAYDSIDQTKLSDEEKTLLENTYNGFRNNGALLQGADRKEYKKLVEKLSMLSNEYGNNLVNSAAGLKVVIEAKDKQRLDGVPEDIIATYRQNARNDPDEADDSYVITMTVPATDVYEYAKDRSLREEVMRVYKKVGSGGQYDNTQIVLDILDARHKVAQLLGFKNHADRTIRPDTRMAGNYQTAVDFVEKNAQVYFPAAKKFYKELTDFALQKDGLTELKAWDTAYYMRLMREAQIGYDPEAMRPYFELENVLQGMFEHTEKLYGVTVNEVKGKYSRLHQDVRTYEVKDGKTGQVKALYFFDPYARKGKSSGAFHISARNVGLHNGQREVPVSGNFCNFTKPTAGKPSLLSAREAETLWHEFGHACHNMLGKGTYPKLTGTNTHTDYVEMPSQVNESWIFKPEVLATYARHYQTGQLIPKDMVKKLQKLAVFEARWQGLRQTQFGMLDLALHTTDPAQITDLEAFQDKIWGPVELIKRDGSPMVLNFGHLFSGRYSAGYYSYKWTEAHAADIFAQFEDQGLYHPVLCKAFTEHLIEPGGTRAPSLLFKDFMEAAGQGRRKIDLNALFRQESLLPDKSDNKKTPPKPEGPVPGL